MNNDIEKFKRLSLPIVRRMYPRLVTQNLISVHPTNESFIDRYHTECVSKAIDENNNKLSLRDEYINRINDSE